MWKKHIVVLANSVKHDPGRCIAGREIAVEDDNFSIGPWIRPVSRIGEGQLWPMHFTLEDGSAPHVFDEIEIYLDNPDADTVQPENWIISKGHAWKRIHKWDMEMVMNSFLERPNGLWLQPGVNTDRVTKQFLDANPPEQSLYLVQLYNAQVCRRTERKYRLHFSYNGVSYDLAITDPLITNITGDQPFSVIHRGIACVSLAPAFYEHHYKLAAMVIRHE